MRRKVKGFTLIECLVAMAILGISSLLLCQGFTQMMKVTNMNNTMSHSLAMQMHDAEIGTKSNTQVYRAGDEVKVDPTNLNSPYSGGHELKITKVGGNNDGRENSINVEVYIARPYLRGDTSPQPASTREDGTDVRYVYFHK